MDCRSRTRRHDSRRKSCLRESFARPSTISSTLAICRKIMLGRRAMPCNASWNASTLLYRLHETHPLLNHPRGTQLRWYPTCTDPSPALVHVFTMFTSSLMLRSGTYLTIKLPIPSSANTDVGVLLGAPLAATLLINVSCKLSVMYFDSP